MEGLGGKREKLRWVKLFYSILGWGGGGDTVRYRPMWSRIQADVVNMGKRIKSEKKRGGGGGAKIIEEYTPLS